MKDTIKKVWSWLSGKKRRIAIIGMLLAKLTPEYTLGHQIGEILKEYGEYLFYVFGSADLAEQTIKSIKNNLPSGLKENDTKPDIQAK